MRMLSNLQAEEWLAVPKALLNVLSCFGLECVCYKGESKSKESLRAVAEQRG
jgi:hypothetical protein